METSLAQEIVDDKFKTLKEIEYEAIIERLVMFRGNRGQAAISLDLPERTLRDKLRKMRIQGMFVPAASYFNRTNPLFSTSIH